MKSIVLPAILLALATTSSAQLLERHPAFSRDEVNGPSRPAEYGNYRGTATIVVNGQTIQMPIQVSIGRPIKNESNLFHFSFGIGAEGQVGQGLGSSALEFRTGSGSISNFQPNGGVVTIQYFQLRSSSSGPYIATLVNDGSAQAVAYNSFRVDNRSDRNSIAGRVRGYLGSSLICAGLKGSQVAFRWKGNQLYFSLGMQGNPMGDITGDLGYPYYFVTAILKR